MSIRELKEEIKKTEKQLHIYNIQLRGKENEALRVKLENTVGKYYRIPHLYGVRYVRVLTIEEEKVIVNEFRPNDNCINGGCNSYLRARLSDEFIKHLVPKNEIDVKIIRREIMEASERMLNWFPEKK
jgi:hypothetical protein